MGHTRRDAGRRPAVPAAMMPMNMRVISAAMVVVAVFLLASGGRPPHAAAGSAWPGVIAATGYSVNSPVTFHCTLDASCPEVMVDGDPFATLGPGPAPFRGYGDPSLELDPASGTLWLSYSWLDVMISDPGPPPVIDFGVRTHLARSDDAGATFSFVREVNSTQALQHPITGDNGWTIHEVSTLVREAPDAWQLLWLTYFAPFGPPERYDFFYNRSLASSPDALGDASAAWVKGYGTSAWPGAAHDLSAEITQLSDCVAFTEPALFAWAGATYLATNCVVYEGATRRDDLERLVLLRQEPGGYSYAGVLLDYSDAVSLGGTRLEQADLSVSRNGAVLLIVTPIQNTQPNHLGCVALEVTDIATAQVRRDAGGDPAVLASITGDDPIMGPGLCTYDSASDTGVMMVLHNMTPDPFDMEFSLRATGVHPNGIDSDADGVADTADNCPATTNGGQADADGDGAGDACDAGDSDGDSLSDQTEYFCGSAPSEPAGIPERVDPPFSGVDDDGDTVIDEPLAPGSEPFDCDGDGYAGTVEDHVFAGAAGRDQDACGMDAWPADLTDGGGFSLNKVNISDVASFVGAPRYFNTNAGTNPGDVRWDVVPGNSGLGNDINIIDLSNIAFGTAPMLGGAQMFNGPSCPW